MPTQPAAVRTCSVASGPAAAQGSEPRPLLGIAPLSLAPHLHFNLEISFAVISHLLLFSSVKQGKIVALSSYPPDFTSLSHGRGRGEQTSVSLPF